MKSAPPPLHLILDLETAPDPHIPAPTPKIERYELEGEGVRSLLPGWSPDIELSLRALPGWNPDVELALRKVIPFPPPPCHRIVCAGYAWLEDYELISWGVLDGIEEGLNPELPPRVTPISSERDILERLTVTIGKSNPIVTGCNTRGFDLPVLSARCFVHGVPFPWYYKTKYPRYRYAQTHHFDLMDFLSDHGASPKASLDAWCKAAGLPGKMGTDGHDVEAMFKAGELKQIADYCMTDVAQEAALLLRVELLRGVLSPARYKKAARSLVDAMQKDLRTAALAARIDRERFCLEEPQQTLPISQARETESVSQPVESCPESEGKPTARRPAGAKRPALFKEP